MGVFSIAQILKRDSKEELRWAHIASQWKPTGP